MKSGVPWQVKGVRPQARETAREAARRSGMSVGEWLDNVILDQALHEGIEPRDPDYRRYDEPSDRPDIGENEEELQPQPLARTRYQDDQDRIAEVDDTDRHVPRRRPRYAEYGRQPLDFDPGQPVRSDHDLVREEARRRADELAERLSLTTREDRYRPVVDRGFAEVKERLDSLTRQLADIKVAAPASPEAEREDRYRPVVDQVFAKVNDRLDNLDRQLGRLAEFNTAQTQQPRQDGRGEEPARELLDVISKLDGRLDQLLAEGRSAKTEIEQRVDAVDRAVADLRDRPHAAHTADQLPPPAAATPLDQALLEIADRQRTLDGYAPASPLAGTPSPEQLPRARTQDLSGLEQQLRQINTQIETLQRPCGIDRAVETLRDDLAEIGVMLQDAMPRKAVEALENEVRKLAERVDDTRHSGADGPTLAGVERGLTEVRDALLGLTPAENLVGIDRAVQRLSQKIDLIADNAQDPAALRQLEGSIVAMRGIVSHVASNDALAKLSDEVRALGQKVDQVASTGAGHVLANLEDRIATLADALEARNQRGQDVPHELETVVRGLSDKIERIQLTRGDGAALGHLEDRIAKLVEKLDASDARLNHLEAIERGLTELLIHLEHQRVPNLARGDVQALPEVEALSRDLADLRQTDKTTQDALEVVHGTLGHVVDRLAMLETDMRSKPVSDVVPMVASVAAPASEPPAPIVPLSEPPTTRPMAVAPPLAPTTPLSAPPPLEEPLPIEPAASLQPGPLHPLHAATMPPPVAVVVERRPIDPTLPPDHPLEPGMARNRTPGSPADRIAASEAALVGARPPVIPDPGGKANFIAAARRAAQAAGRDTPAKVDQSSAPANIASAASKLASRVGKLRTLIGGGAAILLVLGSMQIARNLVGSDESDGASQVAPTRVAATALEAPPAPTTVAPASEPASITAPTPSPAPQPPGRQSPAFPTFDASTVLTPTPGVVIPLDGARPATTAAKITSAAPEREPTGTVPPAAKPALGPAPTPSPPAAPSPALQAAAPNPQSAPITAADKLPAAFSASLRTAATKGDPAAQYEVAMRYVEGRGVQQSLTDAAEWLERAAKQGLAPAQFKLGGLYEKGLGVKKNLDTARRLYLSAGEAGNAKALHNLAVLYAEGIDGKPDYQTASRWFRKAADYGVTDSQYNLAVLYARGIGMEQNLTESYKWFTLAARDGDAESVKKRDEIGARLDPQALQAATQAAQAWTAERQPDAAVQVKAPSGGWGEGPSASAAPPAPAPSPAQAKRKPPVASPKLDPLKLDLATPRSAQ
jgi:localization factor PodJL